MLVSKIQTYLSDKMHLKKVIRNKHAILQGSILGPILFLCFINDLPLCIDLFTLLFADDTASLSSGPELKPLLNKVNAELKKLSKWFRANRMAVNVNKTKYMIFKTKGKKVQLNDEEGIFYDDNDDSSPYDQTKVTKLDRVYNDNPNHSDRTYTTGYLLGRAPIL
jgi:Reverse transcriptase (RNA-dependent DNA polymerase)